MELSEIYTGNKTRISFEIFPPKNGDISTLFDELRILKKYKPALVSLTFSADGSNSDFSLEILRMILDLELTPMPHFTGICTSKEQALNHIIQIENMGIENILALRGNKVNKDDLGGFDFLYANEFVEYIKEKSTLAIGVGGYVEGHPESVSLEDDIINLKKKVEAGASAIFTSMFFDNNKFYKYVDSVRKAGIDLPIIAGIMPVQNLEHAKSLVKISGIKIPERLMTLLEKQPESTKPGINYAIYQCKNLIDNKVSGLHFYTLNRSDMVSEIMDNIEI